MNTLQPFSELITHPDVPFSGPISGYIYCLLVEENTPAYIGKTTRDVKTRFKEHLYEARRGCLCRKCRWVRKVGSENVTCGAIDVSRQTTGGDYLSLLESMYIVAYREANKKYDKNPLTNIFAFPDEVKIAIDNGWLQRHKPSIFKTAEENISLIKTSRLSEIEKLDILKNIDEYSNYSEIITKTYSENFNGLKRKSNSIEHNLAISEAMKKLPPFGAHQRWHTNRELNNEDCILCNGKWYK